MFKKKNLAKLIFLTVIISFFAIAGSSMAAGLLPEASGSSDCVKDGNSPAECGDYTVSDIASMAITISNWIFGIVGSLTLLMFVYGGFMFLISAGSSDKVSSAKKIITAAVVGLVIVFASYVIINFILGTVLGVGFTGTLPS